MEQDHFFHLLQELTVDCKDDQTAFVVQDRILILKKLLESSVYRLVYSGELAYVYMRSGTDLTKPYVLISSHIDCVYTDLCATSMPTTYHGTFDNSLTNACLIDLMLRDALPDGVVVAFTGAEEQGNYDGASEVVQFVQAYNDLCRLALVLDVTNEGYASYASFTLENDQGIDLFSAHRLVERLKHVRDRFVLVHDGLPDETWFYYPQFNLPTLSLCIPVDGDMHEDSGVTVRKSSIRDYQAALQTVVDCFLAY